MALTLTLDKTTASSGDIVTATYGGLTLSPGTPDLAITDGSGSASVNGGAPQTVVGLALTIKGKPADTVVYNPPKFTGLTFAQSPTNPAVWTAKVP